jgi:hypothetical protein
MILSFFMLRTFSQIVIGPSEVRALPVRRCKRAAWQTKWPVNLLFFYEVLILRHTDTLGLVCQPIGLTRGSNS